MTLSDELSYNIFLCSVPLLCFRCRRSARLSHPRGLSSSRRNAVCSDRRCGMDPGRSRHPSGAEPERRLALIGGLLLLPFALVSLLWVGLGTPGEAAPAENKMRFLVLLVASIAVTGGFVVLEQALHEAGERFYVSLGAVSNILAGAAYLVWASFHLGGFVSRCVMGKGKLYQRSFRRARCSTRCCSSRAF